MLSPIDRHVARRLRGKRLALGLTEGNLALQLGIEPERIMAYERAEERVPTEHLLRLSTILGVPLSYFFPVAPCPGR